jgi:hypothetical protein
MQSPVMTSQGKVRARAKDQRKLQLPFKCLETDTSEAGAVPNLARAI